MFLSSRLFNSYFFGFVVLIAVSSDACAKQWQLESPNGALTLSLRYQDDIGLQYRLIKDQSQTIIDWSQIGLNLSWPDTSQEQSRKSLSFDNQLDFLARVDQSIDDSYTMLHGKTSVNNYAARESRFLFQHKPSKKQLRLDIQLADDGLAFRYVLPEVSSLSHWIKDDITEFNIALQQQFWAQAYEQDESGRISYQLPYIEGDFEDGKTNQIALPVLVETEQNIWLLLHESNLNNQYHGSHLSTTKAGEYTIASPVESSVNGLGAAHAITTLPATLPWRFIVVSSDLADIVESNRVFDLADENELSDTDWIQAGSVSGSAESGQQERKRPSKLRRFINLSAQMQWPYSLLDSGWQDMGDKAVADLVAYANKRKVNLGVWYNSGGNGNIANANASYIMNRPQARKAEFKRLRSLGIRYIKVDLFDGDKQIMIQHYLDILKDAADHQLMVVFHGSTVPRGWARTYPNLMAMEAVGYGEFNSKEDDSDVAELAVMQNSILPFTRNTIGSMDFTPITFSNAQRQYPSSNAHQAALGVVFESALQHMPDNAKSYRQTNSIYRDYLSNLPTAWEQTRFLSGYPGKDIVLARRSGNTWYVAGINGEQNLKHLEFSLDFLSSAFHRDLAKSAILISDANNPNDFNAREFELGAASKLKIKVAPAGGFVMIIKLD